MLITYLRLEIRLFISRHETAIEDMHQELGVISLVSTNIYFHRYISPYIYLRAGLIMKHAIYDSYQLNTIVFLERCLQKDLWRSTG